MYALVDVSGDKWRIFMMNLTLEEAIEVGRWNPDKDLFIRRQPLIYSKRFGWT